MKNISEAIRQLEDETGELPSYAWPGGYPLFYMDAGNNVLCPVCANKADEYTEPVIAYDANYEDDNLYCDDCGKKIDAAYDDNN